MTRVHSTEDIEKNIPHRLPMRFIEKVTEDGNKVTGSLREIFQNDPIFKHQDRNLSYLEGIEACAQTAAIRVLKDTQNQAIVFKTIEDLNINRDGVLILSNAKFEANIVEEEGYAYIKAFDESKTYFEGKIFCALMDKDRFKKLLGIVSRKAPHKKDEPIMDIFPVIGGSYNDVVLCEYNHCNSVSTLLRLTDGYPIVNGHFPDYSVMPAIFVIFGADKSIRMTFGAEKLVGIEYFEFVVPIIPPSRIDYSIKYDINGKFSVEVKSNDMLAAKGILRYDYDLITKGRG